MDSDKMSSKSGVPPLHILFFIIIIIFFFYFTLVFFSQVGVCIAVHLTLFVEKWGKTQTE